MFEYDLVRQLYYRACFGIVDVCRVMGFELMLDVNQCALPFCRFPSPKVFRYLLSQLVLICPVQKLLSVIVALSKRTHCLVMILLPVPLAFQERRSDIISSLSAAAAQSYRYAAVFLMIQLMKSSRRPRHR